MAFLPYLLNLLTFVPTIVAQVQKEHAEKDVATKTQIAQQWLTVASSVAQGVLPPTAGAIASGAATLAQDTLAASVAAVHNAALTDAQATAPTTTTTAPATTAPTTGS